MRTIKKRTKKNKTFLKLEETILATGTQEICCSTSAPSSELPFSMSWASRNPDANSHFLFKLPNPCFPRLD